MNWPLVGLIGGLVGVDATSFPQVMISRPLVAGTLAGWALGDPAAGALLGALHELFGLSVLPVGAARYPEPGTATVAATAGLLAAQAAAAPAWPALLLAIAFALAWERVAGGSVVLYRRGIERVLFAPGADGARQLERRHSLALLLDFVRAAVVTLLGGALATLVIGVLAPRIALPAIAVQAGIAIAAGAALGGTIGVFGGWSQRRASLIIGALTGCGLLLLTR